MVRLRFSRHALAMAAAALVAGAAPLAAHVRITTDLTFSEDVRPILRKYCMSCHRPGGSAPSYVDLTTYGDDRAPGARAWAAAMEEEVLTGRMPPWQADARFDHFANTRRMTKDEIDILVGWIGGGAPQGPRRDLPAPPEFEEGAWQLGEPDAVVEPAEAYVLHADTGHGETVAVVDVPVEADTWVTGFEFKPEHPGTVYRMAAWILDPEDAAPESLEVEVQVPYDPFRDENAPVPTREYAMPKGEHFLGQWLRGDAPVLLPAGMGKRLRAGSKVRLVTEYRRRDGGPSGDVSDRSRLGLFLAQQPDEVDLIALSAEAKPAEATPPQAAPSGEKKRKKSKKSEEAASAAMPAMEKTIRFDEEARLVSLSPDLGTALDDVEIDLRYPDGRSELLLLIDDYDPRWPASYQLEEPLSLPAGATVTMRGHFADAEDASEGSHDFDLEATYALNDHLVLPPVLTAATKTPQSRGGMMLLGDLGGKLPAGATGGATGAGAADASGAAHMDHSPLHGGQFFMASNNYHHVEGALPSADEFRLWVYDDFKRPVDPRNFAGQVVFEEWDEKNQEWDETSYPLEYGGPGTEYLKAKIPGALPAEFYASVWLAGEQTRFDFYFEEYSKELSAAELAKYSALGPHSHVRPPLAIPDRPEDVVSEIVKRTDLLRELIDGAQWLGLHAPAFDARDLAEALLEKLGRLSARDRGTVKQAISRTMQSAAELDRAGDLADAGRARRAFARYSQAVRVLADTFGS